MTASASAWRGILDAYAEPRLGRSLLDLGTSVVPYLALLVSIYFALRVSDAVAVLLAVPASGFLIRTFVVFHDCSHGSFLRSKRATSVAISETRTNVRERSERLSGVERRS